MCTPSAGQYPAGGQSSSRVRPACVPADEISTAAFEYARAHLPAAILNHSIRVYLIAINISSHNDDAREKSPEQHIFWASILHDIGATVEHDGPQRFEVEGADAAVELLKSHKVSKEVVHDVWTAIALHTSPGIAERITPLARLVRLAVLCDFGRPAARQLVDASKLEAIERDFPRLQIEQVLGDAVVEQALNQREKAPPASWPGILLRSKLENPDWAGVNKAF